MNHRPPTPHHISPVVGILGSKWALLIIRTFQHDTLRFSQLQKRLPSTAQKVLTETLRRLERNGIVARKAYPTVPPQVEYRLTPLGLELLELSGVLSEWADTHEEAIKRAQKAYDQRNKL